MANKEAPKGNTLADVPQTIAIAQLEHYGDKLIIPEGMDLAEALELIERRQKYLEEDMAFAETFDFHPYDGANAINIVLERTFGWSCAEPTPGMFGPRPPALINVQVGPGEMRKVPWGRFSIPGCEDAWIATGVAYDGQKVRFQIQGVIKRKYEDKVTKIFDGVREELQERSIYRGKAIKLRFKDDDGDTLDMPTPEFMDLTDVDEEMLIYSESVQRQINTNLFIPIERVQDCIDNGINVKRGVLLAGTYGTGKTLAAKVAAKKAVQTGNTFIYTPHADELNKAIEFALQYQSPACVIFCEDIDRAIAGERTVQMDDILNIIDGIDTKTARIITVLTSNHLEEINPALLRPGRLDAVIEVTPPDARAVEKLIRAYGNGAIASSVNLDKAAALLEGNIPAVIAEVVKRAKIAQLARQAQGTKVTSLSEDAIIEAAESIKYQVDLLRRRAGEPPRALPTLETAVISLVRSAVTGRAHNVDLAAEYQTN